MIAQLDRCGVEMEVLGGEGLLPCLQGGHGVVAEFISEAADRIGGVIECKRGVVVVIVYHISLV